MKMQTQDLEKDALNQFNECTKKVVSVENQIGNGDASKMGTNTRLTEFIEVCSRWMVSCVVFYIECLCPKISWLIDELEFSNLDDQARGARITAAMAGTLRGLAESVADSTGKHDIGEKIQAISRSLASGTSLRELLDLLRNIATALRDAAGWPTGVRREIGDWQQVADFLDRSELLSAKPRKAVERDMTGFLHFFTEFCTEIEEKSRRVRLLKKLLHVARDSSRKMESLARQESASQDEQ